MTYPCTQHGCTYIFSIKSTWAALIDTVTTIISLSCLPRGFNTTKMVQVPYLIISSYRCGSKASEGLTSRDIRRLCRRSTFCSRRKSPRLAMSGVSLLSYAQIFTGFGILRGRAGSKWLAGFNNHLFCWSQAEILVLRGCCPSDVGCKTLSPSFRQTSWWAWSISAWMWVPTWNWRPTTFA